MTNLNFVSFKSYPKALWGPHLFSAQWSMHLLLVSTSGVPDWTCEGFRLLPISISYLEIPFDSKYNRLGLFIWKDGLPTYHLFYYITTSYNNGATTKIKSCSLSIRVQPKERDIRNQGGGYRNCGVSLLVLRTGHDQYEPMLVTMWACRGCILWCVLDGETSNT